MILDSYLLMEIKIKEKIMSSSINVCVRTLAGEKKLYEMSGSHTVLDLKKRYYGDILNRFRGKPEFHPSQLQFFMMGNVLQDTQTISYAFSDEICPYVVLLGEPDRMNRFLSARQVMQKFLDGRQRMPGPEVLPGVGGAGAQNALAIGAPVGASSTTDASVVTPSGS